MDTIKKYFTQSHFTSISDILLQQQYMQQQQYNEEVRNAFMLSSLFISLVILSIMIGGFMVVPRLCSDNSERGKNTRLGLYVLLLLTGGQIGWLYVILWLAKVNICA
jgi:hypothetical protein